MKMKPEHVKVIGDLIGGYLKRHPDFIDDYETGNFHRADRVKDLNERFRWDLLRVAVPLAWISELYSYLDDSHIDTALRNVCPKITRRY